MLFAIIDQRNAYPHPRHLEESTPHARTIPEPTTAFRKTHTFCPFRNATASLKPLSWRSFSHPSSHLSIYDPPSVADGAMVPRKTKSAMNDSEAEDKTKAYFAYIYGEIRKYLPFHSWTKDLQPTEVVDKKLESVFGIIEELRNICQVPSISIGVIHRRKVVLTHGFGATDPRADNPAPPDEETLYTLCSISKAFVSAAVGILVEEGKLDWADPVGKYVPEFKPNGDPRVATEATFNDFLRHSGGLSNPVITMLAQQGKVLVQQRDFIELVNEARTDDRGQPYFNREYQYSNIAYGLIALVVEKVSGMRYADFLQERILDPLGMTNTAVFKNRLLHNGKDGGDPNVAHAYAKLDNESWSFLDHEWTSEDNSPILGMVGVRSSVRDMMIFSAAVMEAWFDDLSISDFAVLADSGVRENPLKQMGPILNGYYWTRPHNDPLQNEAAYHLGWLRARMPTCMVSWGSWNSVLARNVTEAEKTFRDQSILGRTSGPRLLYKSVGIGFCGTNCLHIFPETQSAVVVFSNGLNCADAADLAASALIQALFDLQPPVDLLSIAKKERGIRKGQFQQIMRDLEDHRDVSAPEANHEDYIGRYYGLAIDLVIRRGSEDGKLQLCLNNRKDAIWPLEYHNVDQYSFWPKTRDDWLKGGWLDWDYYMVGVLSFKRDVRGAVNGATWVLEKRKEPYFFQKMRS
ncbi:beta-lactamase/transpeptidase-like protein [Echria macrotheca]|uniref:Beta-lactamase/transpeptidase-like protein n=1 Tax=Echria macrotheca TaxID=438768 RepID=A0AAJ0FAD5_9PEZI|nr:beta-lactamase/transpeptidase-like protein [Echria macrotheca]